MSTIIREYTLDIVDDKDVPNKNAAIVQGDLDEAGGCKSRLKGIRCRGELEFDAMKGEVICKKHRQHTREAWDGPNGKTVLKTIARFVREDSDKAKAASKHFAEAFALKQARSEAEALNLKVDDTFHLRPDGCAPDGQTWSYLTGKWIPIPERKRKAEFDP